MRYFCGHIKLIIATKNTEQRVSVAKLGRGHLNLGCRQLNYIIPTESYAYEAYHSRQIRYLLFLASIYIMKTKYHCWIK